MWRKKWKFKRKIKWKFIPHINNQNYNKQSNLLNKTQDQNNKNSENIENNKNHNKLNNHLKKHIFLRTCFYFIIIMIFEHLSFFMLLIFTSLYNNTKIHLFVYTIITFLIFMIKIIIIKVFSSTVYDRIYFSDYKKYPFILCFIIVIFRFLVWKRKKKYCLKLIKK
jgi:magnesium-transporting ATPase (P-type)